jgi:hypothetical protein
MSYQLIVEFSEGKIPSEVEVQMLLRGFDPNFTNSGENVFRSLDPYSGDSLSVELGQPNQIRLQVPYSAMFRSVAAAYTLAWALADKFGGRVRDPQLGGAPSLDLARQEWRKHEASGDLTKIFGGTIPNDLKTRIRQRRGLLSQEIEIRGTELGIQRRQSGRSVNYFVPILSLRPVQENTVPNPLGILLVFAGLFILIAAGVAGKPLGGEFFVVAIIVIPLSLMVFYKFKRRLLVFPGEGGKLVLEAASPSKTEVEQFLSSIDRVRFALSRPQARGPSMPRDTDTEKMRVT